ncbi:hypothetical protein LL033_09930 [Clostridium estertheticum]|nr:hypothetical protein [Clostridium estertheticum]WAG57475.1 hypothetical protein LL033_09930 [Clostridium estertheticum]
MESVISKLNNFDIYPEERSDIIEYECKLKEKIITRSDEIRNSWICDVIE